MKRIPLTNAAEHDCFSGWRRVLCYMLRPGVKKSIRQGYNRRFRRDGKAEAKKMAKAV